MTIVTRATRLYSRPPERIIPALDPLGSNAHLFLTDFEGKRLVNEIFLTDNTSIETAPIRTGVKFDLFGNSNANLLIQLGRADVASTIDPTVYLRQIFFTIEDELFSAFVNNDPMAKAQPVLLSDTRSVKFANTLFPIAVTKDTKNYFEDVPYWMPMLTNEVHSAFTLGFEVTGELALSRGTLQLDVQPYNFGHASQPDTELSKFMTRLKDSVKVVAYTLDAHFTTSYNKSY